MSKQTYTIRDLSQKYNIPASTLRYYEDMGLLTDVIHTDRGARIYTQKHIERLEGILCFKRTGLPIAKIQEYYRYETDIAENIEEIVTMMVEQEQDILRQLEDLNVGLEHIRQKIYYYDLVKKSLQNGRPMPAWCEVFPGK